MRLHRCDHVACSIKIALPDKVGILRTEDGGEMDDSGNPLDSVRQGREIENIARHSLYSLWAALAGPEQDAAGETSLR
jgi:hypothetical protein